MSSHPRLAGLLTCLLALASALPAQADIASPARDRRKAAVAQWHKKHPGTAPEMAVALSPDGKTLALRFETKTPADYRIELNGKEAAKGKVADLKGGVATQTVSLAEHPGRHGRWRVAASFTLKGVRQDGAKLAETGDSIYGCLFKRFEIVEKGGKPVLNELGLDGEDYFFLRGCGL